MLDALTTRPYQDPDAGRVTEFFALEREHDPSVDVVSEASWRRFTHEPMNKGGRDFVLVERGAQLLAVLHSSSLLDPAGGSGIRHFGIVVARTARRNGIGQHLLRMVEHQAKAQGGAVQQSHCNLSWTAGVAFLEANGFVEVNADWIMERPAGHLPACEAVPGILIRPYVGADDNANWMQLHNRCYQGTFAYAPLHSEDIVNQLRAPGAHIWFAEHEHTIVGVCHSLHLSNGYGLIHSLLVAPKWRHRGLARMLLSETLATLSRQGTTGTELHVSRSNYPAVNLYRSAGFIERDQLRVYRRHLERSP